MAAPTGIVISAGIDDLVETTIAIPDFLIKILPRVDRQSAKPIEYYPEHINLKGASTGSAALSFGSHGVGAGNRIGGPYSL